MQGHGHRRAVQLPCRIHAAARWKDMQRSVRSPADAGRPTSLAGPGSASRSTVCVVGLVWGPV